MRPVEHRVGQQSGAPGKTRPAIFRVYLPKASAPKLLHADAQTKTPEDHSRVPVLPISHGASPVASALGFRLGATPCGLTYPNSPSWIEPLKQDITTLLGLGHFYFALTGSELFLSLVCEMSGPIHT